MTEGCSHVAHALDFRGAHNGKLFARAEVADAAFLDLEFYF
jgi:hypothetical protein